MLSDSTKSELTPACALDFYQRLELLMSEAGIHSRGFIGFLVAATGLSKSGAQRIINDKRPPKRNDVFLLLANALTDAVNAKKEAMITVDEVVDYLLKDKQIKALQAQDNFDVSEYLKIDPVLTSQIIIKIENVARGMQINTATDIRQQQLKLIHFRIIAYCFKNQANYETQKVTNLIESLFELAKQNLL